VKRKKPNRAKRMEMKAQHCNTWTDGFKFGYETAMRDMENNQRGKSGGYLNTVNPGNIINRAE
jgi:hypothetical protein